MRGGREVARGRRTRGGHRNTEGNGKTGVLVENKVRADGGGGGSGEKTKRGQAGCRGGREEAGYEATTANLHNITNYCSNRRRSADSITIVIQLMLGISSIRVPGTAFTYA